MKPGRNDPCPCGSGKKYKRCCALAPAAADSAEEPLDSRAVGALVALVEQERSSEAEQGARVLLQAHPDAGMLWKILGVALMRQGKDALAALRKTAELMPRDAEAHANLGTALRDRRQWSEALPSLRRALDLRPDDLETLIDAAEASKALGRTRESVTLYQRALEIDPGSLEARNDLGNAWLELGEFDHAVRCYRLALDLAPQRAQVHCNLGNALRLLGRLDEAAASSRRALALDPALGEAHRTLGHVLAAQGRLEEAVASHRRALALIADAEALNDIGNALRDLGRRQDAIGAYSRAVECDPGRAQSHCNLGNALLEVPRIDEAIASYRRALALRPDYALAQVSLGTALRLQGRASEAESSCAAALAADPDDVDALSLLGDLRADRGRFREAEASFQRAIAVDPEFPFAYFNIAAHRRMTLEDTAWLEGARRLLAKRLPLRHEISLHYALGKYHDDVGQYPQAFDHYRRANELTKGYGARYDGAALTRRVDGITRSFDAAAIGQPRSGASPSEIPVFVIGMPRSGTSLTEQILASHPAVFGAGELTFWGGAFAAYEHAGLMNQAGASLVPGMARDYLERLRTLSGGTLRTVDKMPANFLYAGLIHTAFPNARIIHMRRHPLDTCLSIYFQNFFSVAPYANDLENLAHYYREYIRITDHWRSVLPATRLLEIPYEELVADQEGWTRRMLDFIGLPWDARCLNFHLTDRVVITSSKWQVRQKIHTSSAGRWRHYADFVGPLRRLMSPSTEG